jgi:hypothetical protein
MSQPRELARLYRPSDTLPDNMLCKFVPAENLLVTNNKHWPNITHEERAAIMRTPGTLYTSVHPVEDLDEAA